MVMAEIGVPRLFHLNMSSNCKHLVFFNPVTRKEQMVEFAYYHSLEVHGETSSSHVCLLPFIQDMLYIKP
jgi:hypothetical protein